MTTALHLARLERTLLAGKPGSRLFSRAQHHLKNTPWDSAHALPHRFQRRFSIAITLDAIEAIAETGVTPAEILIKRYE
jgi:hypothetical protein